MYFAAFHDAVRLGNPKIDKFLWNIKIVDIKKVIEVNLI